MRDAVIGLIGLPRSGTTLIHRAMAAHARVDGVIEPYQTRRASGYGITALADFLADHNIAADPGRALVVKETTTRAVNAQHLFELLGSAQSLGIYAGLVIILRCPFAAYLSQIEAARELWTEKKLTEQSAAAFDAFAQVARNGLREVVTRARRQHYRIISYEQFCAAPDTELARLMALIPYPMQPQQLALAPAEGGRRGGDPKSYQKGSEIIRMDRAGQVAELAHELRGQPLLPFFHELHHLCLEEACRLPDAAVLDHLTEMVLRRGG